MEMANKHLVSIRSKLEGDNFDHNNSCQREEDDDKKVHASQPDEDNSYDDNDEEAPAGLRDSLPHLSSCQPELTNSPL